MADVQPKRIYNVKPYVKNCFLLREHEVRKAGRRMSQARRRSSMGAAKVDAELREYASEMNSYFRTVDEFQLHESPYKEESIVMSDDTEASPVSVSSPEWAFSSSSDDSMASTRKRRKAITTAKATTTTASQSQARVSSVYTASVRPTPLADRTNVSLTTPVASIKRRASEGRVTAKKTQSPPSIADILSSDLSPIAHRVISTPLSAATPLVSATPLARATPIPRATPLPTPRPPVSRMVAPTPAFTPMRPVHASPCVLVTPTARIAEALEINTILDRFFK